MKLSRSSWHYKLYAGLWTDKSPKNFCAYFWGAVGATICALFIGGFVCFFGLFILGGIAFFPFHIHDKFKNGTLNDQLQSAGVVGWVLIGIALLGTIIYLIFSKDNLSKEFFKALIGGYCPKIDWSGNAPEKEYSDYELLKEISKSHNNQDGNLFTWIAKANKRVEKDLQKPSKSNQ